MDTDIQKILLKISFFIHWFLLICLVSFNFFIEECKVIRIFLLLLILVPLINHYLLEVIWQHLFWIVYFIIFSPKLRLRVFKIYICWGSLAVVTMIATGLSITTWMLIIGLNVWSRMTRSIFITNSILISSSSSCWSHSSLTDRISSSTLIKIERRNLWMYIFPLTNLRTIFHTVCLLDEKHISMVLRCLNNLWPCSPTFNISLEALVGLWTHRTIIMSAIILGWLLGFCLWAVAISSPKPSKSGWIHLLLYQKTHIGIIEVVLHLLIEVVHLLVLTIAVELTQLLFIGCSNNGVEVWTHLNLTPCIFVGVALVINTNRLLLLYITTYIFITSITDIIPSVYFLFYFLILQIILTHFTWTSDGLGSSV